MVSFGRGDAGPFPGNPWCPAMDGWCWHPTAGFGFWGDVRAAVEAWRAERVLSLDRRLCASLGHARGHRVAFTVPPAVDESDPRSEGRRYRARTPLHMGVLPTIGRQAYIFKPETKTSMT
jgi:hypothetical protein